jgi:spermidine/putrescine transport system ATP-binding protein
VKVIGEEFVGATATIYLETPQGHEIRVQKSHDELADLPRGIGQELFAHWSPADSHLVAEA